MPTAGTHYRLQYGYPFGISDAFRLSSDIFLPIKNRQRRHVIKLDHKASRYATFGRHSHRSTMPQANIFSPPEIRIGFDPRAVQFEAD